MDNRLREWDAISDDPNELEVTEEQLRATNRLLLNSDGRHQQQKFDEMEDELMFLGEDCHVSPEQMDAQIEEELLGRAPAVVTEKATSLTNPTKQKKEDVKNCQPKQKKSMFGSNYVENMRRFQFEMYGVPAVGPIQFGGGMDLSLISNKSDASIGSGSTKLAEAGDDGRFDAKAKVKKTRMVSTTKKSALKRPLKRNIVNNHPIKKASNNVKRNDGGPIKVKKRRSKSLDSVLRSKWDTSSSFLDVTSTTDQSSIFDEPKFAVESCGSTSNSQKSKEKLNKFSLFSSTERMMSEWVKRKNNNGSATAGGRQIDRRVPNDGGQHGGESDSEESADELQQQSDASDGAMHDEDNDGDGIHFFGLLGHKETPKKRYLGKPRTSHSSTSSSQLRLSRTSIGSQAESLAKLHDDSSPYYSNYEFSPRTTLFVCPVPLNLDENGLMRYFVCFGEVRSVFLPPNPITGEHRGFGFVDFYSESSALAAFAERGMIWPRGGQKPFNLTWYRPRPPVSSSLSPNAEIHVFELSEKCTESALYSYFGRYGRVEHAQIGRPTDGGRRAALIRFSSREGASSAIAANPKLCNWVTTAAEHREHMQQQQNGTPPIKKWDNIFDLSKSNSPDTSHWPFRPMHFSENAVPTVRKQFFPNYNQRERRAFSVGRFSSNDDASYNCTPDRKSLTDNKDGRCYLSAPVRTERNEKEEEHRQRYASSRSTAYHMQQRSIATPTKRRLSYVSSSDDDSDERMPKRHVPREGQPLRRSINANNIKAREEQHAAQRSSREPRRVKEEGASLEKTAFLEQENIQLKKQVAILKAKLAKNKVHGIWG